MGTLLYGALPHGCAAFGASRCSFACDLLLDGSKVLLGHILGKTTLLLEIREALVDLCREQLLHPFAQHHNNACRMDGVVRAQQGGKACVFRQQILADLGQSILCECRCIQKLIVLCLHIAWVIGVPHGSTMAHEPVEEIALQLTHAGTSHIR